MARVTVTLSPEELSALQILARKERRDTRSQAAFIIQVKLEKCGLIKPAAASKPRDSPIYIKKNKKD